MHVICELTCNLEVCIVAAMKNAARKAIELAALRAALDEGKTKGSKAALGRKFGISRQAVKKWGDTIPPEYVAPISVMSGVPPHKIRPDVFPPPQATPAE